MRRYRTQRRDLSVDDLLALGTAALWTGGALVARRQGLWRGVGPTGLIAGTIAVIGGGRRVRRRLRPRLSDLLVGLIGGVAMSAVTEWLYPVVARAAPATVQQAERLYGTFATLPRKQAALLLIPIILSEELVWRGVVQEALARRHGRVRGLLFGTLAYGAAHAAVGSPLLSAVTLVCGLAWGALAAGTGALVAPLGAHAVWNGWVLFARPLAPAPPRRRPT